MCGEVLEGSTCLHFKMLNSGVNQQVTIIPRVSRDFVCMGLGKVREEGGAESQLVWTVYVLLY